MSTTIIIDPSNTVEIAKYILDFLHNRRYGDLRGIEKLATNISTRQYFALIEFIIKEIDHSIITPSIAMDSDRFLLLKKTLGCPIPITRASLSVVSNPTTWPHTLYCTAWFVQLATEYGKHRDVVMADLEGYFRILSIYITGYKYCLAMGVTNSLSSSKGNATLSDPDTRLREDDYTNAINSNPPNRDSRHRLTLFRMGTGGHNKSDTDSVELPTKKGVRANGDMMISGSSGDLSICLNHAQKDSVHRVRIALTDSLNNISSDIEAMKAQIESNNKIAATRKGEISTEISTLEKELALTRHDVSSLKIRDEKSTNMESSLKEEERRNQQETTSNRIKYRNILNEMKNVEGGFEKQGLAYEVFRKKDEDLKQMKERIRQLEEEICSLEKQIKESAHSLSSYSEGWTSKCNVINQMFDDLGFGEKLPKFVVHDNVIKIKSDIKKFMGRIYNGELNVCSPSSKGVEEYLFDMDTLLKFGSPLTSLLTEKLKEIDSGIDTQLCNVMSEYKAVFRSLATAGDEIDRLETHNRATGLALQELRIRDDDNRKKWELRRRDEISSLETRSSGEQELLSRIEDEEKGLEGDVSSMNNIIGELTSSITVTVNERKQLKADRSFIKERFVNEFLVDDRMDILDEEYLRKFRTLAFDKGVILDLMDD